MADWSMEPAAAWVPCDLQLTNWPTGPAVCSTGLPLEYGSTEIFGSCLQTSIPVSNGGKLVEYTVVGEYDTMETSVQEFVVDLHNIEKIIRDPILEELADVVDDYENDIKMIGRKIHRYPASIMALNLSERYTVPMVVSIGPYYYGQEHLKKAEKVKLVAAYNCSKDSGHSVQEMYDKVVREANSAWRLYDGDMMAHISHEDFLPMMFLDACFLVQYMLVMSYDRDDSAQKIDTSFCSFFDSNDNEIYHDIMLLENQLPWKVVEAVMEFVNVPLEKFIDSVKGCLQDRKEQQQVGTTCIRNYEPPHLLGLLRFYIVGQNNTKEDTTAPESSSIFSSKKSSSISFSISAVELAEIGVTLKPSETTEIIHMGLKTTGTLFAELSLAPLSLDSARASWLINMAALELCMASNFSAANDEESAVCSYLLLLAMLVDREEDVQELRTKRLLQGGGGLNNREALDFFTSVQSLRLGTSYVRIMEDIETYKNNRRTRTSVHAFFYKNIRIIAAVLSAIVTIVSILGTLISLKNS